MPYILSIPAKILIVTLNFVKMSHSFLDKGQSLITSQLTGILFIFIQYEKNMTQTSCTIKLKSFSKIFIFISGVISLLRVTLSNIQVNSFHFRFKRCFIFIFLVFSVFSLFSYFHYG